MRRPTWALWAAALATGLTAAQEPPKQDPPKKDDTKQQAKPSTPADEFAAVQKEIQKLQQEAMKKFREEKDPQEKNKIRESFMATARKMTLDVARKHPKEPAALQALGMAGTKEAYDLLLEHWVDDDKMGMVTLQASQQESPETVAFIRSVREKSKNEKVKGNATLALAMALKNQAGNAEEDSKIAALNAEAEKIFEDIEKNHGKLQTPFGPAGEYAKKSLFELRHLAVGKPAPEIEGKDIDDKPIKLSDYRGKVILLDFWAHW
jgi:hypothetical protein